MLIEHQSTINENMPLKVLSYITRIYEKILDKETFEGYGKISRPEFIVLYNGKEDFPEKKYLKFSDIYEEIDQDEILDDKYPIKLELIVTMYNINKGFNQNLKRKCKTLSNYAFFIAKIREYERKYSKEDAVKLAINYCIKKSILEDYLKKHSVEVVSMTVLEYDVKTAISAASKIAMEQGIEQGKNEGQDYVLKLMAQGLSYEEIKKKLEKTPKKKHK